MSLQVKLIPEVSHKADQLCPGCGALGVALLSFTVFAQEGSDTMEARCLTCLAEGETLSALIEPPDLSPGRRPPSKRLVKRTRKEERELAADVGGRRQVASGALPA
jgi:hypothetical protein